METEWKEMTSNQRKILLEEFKANSYLEEEEKHHMAESLNVSAQSIAVWHAHRCSSQRRKGLLAKGKYSSTKLAIIVHYGLHIQDGQMNTHIDRCKHTNKNTHNTLMSTHTQNSNQQCSVLE